MTTPFSELLIADVRASATCKVHGLVDMARLSEQEQASLLERFGEHGAPLFTQPELESLRMLGPWLFSAGPAASLSAQHDFLQYLNKAAGDAVAGWITSELSTPMLADHLSQANVVYAPDGQRCLLRYHTETALPLLHARSQQPGLHELFAPITSWWYPYPHATHKVWKGLCGGGLHHSVPLPAIHLDEPTWNALAGDPLAYTLANTLKDSLTAQQLPNNCHGTRLHLAQHHLRQAREQGLSRPGDLNDYVLLMAHITDGLPDDPAWQAAMDEARAHGRPLAAAYRARRLRPH